MSDKAHKLTVESIVSYLVYNGITAVEDVSEKDCEELMLAFLKTEKGKKYFDGLRDRMYDDLEELFNNETSHKGD